MINPYAIGKLIYLRAPSLEDATDTSWFEWFSDPETTRYMGDFRYWPNTREMQVEFYEGIKKSKDRLVLLICSKETDELIGVCNLSSISWVSRNAHTALVIGKEKYRKGPVAVETFSLMLDIAFNRLNLMNVCAGHIETNPITPALCKLFKFKEAGRFVKFSYYFGEYVDQIFYQLNKNDWLLRNKS